MRVCFADARLIVDAPATPERDGLGRQQNTTDIMRTSILMRKAHLVGNARAGASGQRIL